MWPQHTKINSQRIQGKKIPIKIKKKSNDDAILKYYVLHGNSKIKQNKDKQCTVPQGYLKRT